MCPNACIDREYCMNSFLIYRTIVDKNKCFTDKYPLFYIDPPANRTPICNGDELINFLKEECNSIVNNNKAALALSGGMDSSILAALLPEGSMTYTFRCNIGNDSYYADEVERASAYATRFGHENKIITITWDDMEKYSPILMKHKGAPIHSIEIQIYKAALQAKADGYDSLIFGEAADSLYGGLDRLLSRDWDIGDFIDFYAFIRPYKVLRHSKMILEPIIDCSQQGRVDAHKFVSTYLFRESINSYINACSTAGIKCILPYANSYFALPIDYQRIRSGETKYVVRKAFQNLYGGMRAPDKIPMPRPMNVWLADWKGPARKEFWANCSDALTGDQKWMLWSLERFLNICDE